MPCTGRQVRKERKIIKGIFPPKLNSIYRHPDYGVIYMTGGSYIGGYGRVSNHWFARVVRKDGTLGREVSFYAGEMLCLNEKYTVTIRCTKIHKKRATPSEVTSV